MKEMILHENEDRLRSVVNGLDLNRIKEYPIDNREAYDLPELYRQDPYRLACKQYEEGKVVPRAQY